MTFASKQVYTTESYGLGNPVYFSTVSCVIMQSASQDLKPTSNAPPSARVAIASCSDHSLQNSGMLPGGVSVKHHSPISSQVAEKFKLKDGSPNKSENLANQRPLRVRIKVSFDKMAHKSATLYGSLGLENTPSSSLGNSAEENRGHDPVSREIADESPTSILEVTVLFMFRFCLFIMS